MRTVVTGGAGFIGSHLVERLLAQGHEVVCIERPGAGRGWLEGRRLDFHTCGLDDPGELKRVICRADVVYHLAALTEARHPDDCYRVNATGTANLLEAAAGCRCSPPRFVFMSSLAAVGPPRPGELLDSDSVPRPLSHYGRSKLHAEAMVHAYSDRVPAVICRFPALYGPRDRVVLKLFRMVAHGFALTIGPWERQVSLLHADDAVTGLLAAAARPAAIGRTYCLAHPEPTTWAGFVTAVARAVGRRPLRLALPVAGVRPVAAVMEGAAWLGRRAAVLNRDRVRELSQASWVCDPGAAIRELGFQPGIPLETGVGATASWLRRVQWI
jgi:nucleoside-diphosphate-sugar epimerase